jgi:hypothetical protein
VQTGRADPEPAQGEGPGEGATSRHGGTCEGVSGRWAAPTRHERELRRLDSREGGPGERPTMGGASSGVPGNAREPSVIADALLRGRLSNEVLKEWGARCRVLTASTMLL